MNIWRLFLSIKTILLTDLSLMLHSLWWVTPSILSFSISAPVSPSHAELSFLSTIHSSAGIVYGYVYVSASVNCVKEKKILD